MSTIETTDGTAVFDKQLGDGISELSFRSENGIDVALLWRQRGNTAVVVVIDHHDGRAFLLDVHENDNALDMFHHPYAYAAHRGIDHECAHRQDLGIAA